jgi:biotin-(acetyl-CoA carboxylase) ligase
MNNKVEINVTISHYVIGQGIQYTSDIDPFYMDASELQYPASVYEAIAEYCEEWASYERRYDANKEDYILEFWRNDERIGKAILSDYADFFMD